MMSAKCLKQAYLLHGMAVITVSLATLLLGIVFLLLENASGWIFILVSMGIISIFSILGARKGCLAELDRQ